MVADWKLKEVEELTEKIKKAKVVGIVDIKDIPSKQFQLIKKRIETQAEVRVSKNSLIKRSLEKAKIPELGEHIRGSTGLILSNLNPAKLNKILRDNRISSPAKAGNIALKDIVIPAGETTLPPGPVIGELQKVGIKAQIKGGKIVVTEDSLVVKAGEKISAEVAAVLTRLGIEPIEIGLRMNAAFEDGVIYTPEVLSIDTEKTLGDMQTAYIRALNLALNSGVYNKETICYFIRDAYMKAMNLAINAEIFNKDTINALLAKANMQMLAVASQVPGLLGEEVKTPTQAVAEDKDKPKKEDKGSEEDAAAGLASLFG